MWCRPPGLQRRAKPASGLWPFSCAPKPAGQRPALQEHTARLSKVSEGASFPGFASGPRQTQPKRSVGALAFLCSQNRRPEARVTGTHQARLSKVSEGASFPGFASGPRPIQTQPKRSVGALAFLCSQNRQARGPRYRNASGPTVQSIGWSPCVPVLPKPAGQRPALQERIRPDCPKFRLEPLHCPPGFRTPAKPTLRRDRESARSDSRGDRLRRFKRVRAGRCDGHREHRDAVRSRGHRGIAVEHRTASCDGHRQTG